MPANKQLKDLIQTMTPSEKRYFKIFAGRHVIGERNKYLLLFEHIDKAQRNGQPAATSEEPEVTFTPADQTYLYQLILRAMRAYNSGKFPHAPLTDMLHDLQFLFDKGLINQCRKLLRKAQKLARKYDYPIKQLELCFFERKLQRLAVQKDYRDQISRINREEQAALEKLQRQADYVQTHDQLFGMVRQKFHHRPGQREAGLEALASQPWLKDEAQANSFELRVTFHLTHYWIGQLNGDADKVAHHSEQLIRIFDDMPHLAREQPGRYVNILNNYLVACFGQQSFDRFPEVVERLKSFPARTLEEEARVFHTAHFQELLYYLNTARLEEGVKLVPAIEQGLQKYRGKIAQSKVVTLCYNVCMLFFVQEKWADMLTWLNKVIYDIKTTQRQDVQDFARLLQLIAHFELGNILFLRDLLRSVRRHFKNHNRLSRFEKLVLHYLSKLGGTIAKDERQELFENFRFQLVTLRKALGQRIFGYDEVRQWVESRVQRKPLAEVL